MISPNPAQPRKSFSRQELNELADSLKRYGMLNPLTVRRLDDGYELIAGERRLRAAKIAGLTHIPCCVINASNEDSSVLAIVENVQRKDLDFFEQAYGLKRLISIYGMTQQEAAEKTGLSQSAVANKLRLLKLTPEAQKEIISAGLSERHARALLALPAYLQQSAAAVIAEKRLTVEQTETMIEKMRTSAPPPKPRKKAAIKDVRIFINAVTHAIDAVRSAGLAADMRREETDGRMILTITSCTRKNA
jgi:ParB family chromosome partitioning protein